MKKIIAMITLICVFAVGFTFGVSAATEVIASVDTTTECKFQLRTSWVGATAVATFDEAEGANCVLSHNHYSYCTENLSGWTNGNTIAITLKNAATVVVTAASVADSNYILSDASLIMLQQNVIGTTTEYTTLTIPYTPNADDSDNIRIWVKPYGHDRVYIKSIELLSVVTETPDEPEIPDETDSILYYSSIADNSIVDTDTDLELEFAYDVDMDKLTASNILVNGSSEMIEDGGLTWDDVMYTLNVDFKDFGYGKRYTVELIDIPFLDTDVTYNGAIRFTTKIPSSEKFKVDCSKGLVFASVNSANAGGNTFDETEKANYLNDGYSMLNTVIPNYQYAEKVRITAKPIAEKGVGFVRMRLANPEITAASSLGGNIYQEATINNISSSEYSVYEYTIDHTNDGGADTARLWIIFGHYIKNVEVTYSDESNNFPYVNKHFEADCSKELVFSSVNSANAGKNTFDETEKANYLNDSYSMLNTVIPNYKNAEKVRITAKPIAEKGVAAVTIRLANSAVTAASSLGGNIYQQSSINNISTDEYEVYEYDVDHTNDGGADEARLWIIFGHYIKKVEVTYSNYIEGSFYLGDYAMYKDYGEATETNVGDANITAGKYSAVISGIYNMELAPKTVMLVNALYEGGKLINIDVVSQELGASESIEAPMVATIESVPDYAEGIELKTFVFDENLTPIYEKIVMNK